MAEPLRSSLSRWAGHEWVQAVVLAIAASLIAFGVTLAIAANWDAIGRPGQFALVAGLLLAGGGAAIANRKLTVPGLLIAFAATGGLLGLLGQTYQTGADIWEMFALWAFLTLPFALASRSDAVWMPWILVTTTAVELWLRQAHGPAFMASADPWMVYASWAMLAGPVLAFLPDERGVSMLGTSRWSFRFALLLALMPITGDALAGLFNEGIYRYVLGLALVGAVAMAVRASRPLDLLALTATAFAIDTLLIAGAVRILVTDSGSNMFTWLLTGFVAMAIVAASVKAILQVAGGDEALAPLNAVLSRSDGRQWPLVILSSLGALLASIPLVVFLGLAFGQFLVLGPGPYIGAAVIAGSAAKALRSAQSGSFIRQFAVTGLAIGLGLLGYGLFRDLGARPASLLLSLVAYALAVTIANRWVATVLGGVGTSAMLFALGGPDWPLTSTAGWSLVAIAWAVSITAQLLPDTHDSNAHAAPLSAIVTGSVVAALLMLTWQSGTTFMLGARLGMGAHVTALSLSPATSLLSLALTLAACYAAAMNVASLRTPAGLALAGTAAVLSYLSPALGPVFLIAAIAATTGRRRLAILAAACILWIVGTYYYSVPLPLITKGLILIALGTVCALASFANGLSIPKVTAYTAPPPGDTRYATPLTLTAMAAIAVTVASSVYAHNNIIAQGQRTYLELAPVDPRSLTQGDYMALRFAITNDAGPSLASQKLSQTSTIEAQLDARGVARFHRIASSNQPPANGYVLIGLTQKGGSWTVGTDAFHFKEGTAQIYQTAKFGEFRVSSNGRAVLVGLADKDLKPLN